MLTYVLQILILYLCIGRINIQWIFCHDEKGEIWVKFLLNEKEVSLPLTTPRYPYYLWSEVEIFFNQRIRMAKEELLSGS